MRDDVVAQRKDVFKQLLGLTVAPLHNNGLGTFQARTNCSQFLYLCPTIPLHDDSADGDGSVQGDASTAVRKPWTLWLFARFTFPCIHVCLELCFGT